MTTISATNEIYLEAFSCHKPVLGLSLDTPDGLAPIPIASRPPPFTSQWFAVRLLLTIIAVLQFWSIITNNNRNKN